MDDSPWEDDPEQKTVRDTEWTKISSEFTNVGYREGITAGKEGALQEGFDAGFAQIGVPLGREVGLARGIVSAVLSILSTRAKDHSEEVEAEARDISKKLGEVRFSDIAPRDLEAEEHARQHLDEGMEVNEELENKRTIEELEDMLGGLGSGQRPGRPTMEEVRVLKGRLDKLVNEIIKLKYIN